MSDTEAQGDSTAASKSAERPWALIIDLDTAAVDGVEALRSAFAKVLSPVGVELDPVLFARFLLGETPTAGVSALFAFLKQPKDKVGAVVEALAPALEDAMLQVPPWTTTKALVKETAKRSGVVVGLTTFAPSLSAKLLDQIGLPGDTEVVQVHPGGCGALGLDDWFRAVHTSQVPEGNCIAVTATADSARSSICSNLTVAAYIGPLTEHQDFSGADWLGKGTSTKDAAAILDILFARTKAHG